MANKKLWLGILAMVLVFGIITVGCDNDTTNGNGFTGDTALNGTWIRDDGLVEIKYNNGNAETSSYFYDEVNIVKYTYTTNNGKIFSEGFYYHGIFYGLENKWYSYEEIMTERKNGNGNIYLSSTIFFPHFTEDYIIDGNKLTLISYAGTSWELAIIYTKK